MTTGELALLAAGILALVVAALLVQRGARQLARWRRRGNAGDTFARIGREVDDDLDLVVRRVEAVRGGQIAPAEIVTLLSETADSLGRASDQVKKLALPAGSEAARDAFLVELMHASQALESILEACLELEGTTQADRRERAPTVMKWGHLNLVRAHESLAEQALDPEWAAGKSATP